jgi:hypothetical protein
MTTNIDSIVVPADKPRIKVADLTPGVIIATQGGTVLRVVLNRLVKGVDGTYKVTLANGAGEEHVRTLAGDDVISTVLCDCGKGAFCPQYGGLFSRSVQKVNVTLKVALDRDSLIREYGEHYTAEQAREYIDDSIRGVVKSSFPFSSGIATLRDE